MAFRDTWPKPPEALRRRTTLAAASLEVDRASYWRQLVDAWLRDPNRVDPPAFPSGEEHILVRVTPTAHGALL